MWPYPTYKPMTWDKFYVNNVSHRSRNNASVNNSGLAAGITLTVFFTVFVLTFVCRLYNKWAESERQRRRRAASNSSVSPFRRSASVDLFTCAIVPAQPPPCYEVAIRMPSSGDSAPPVYSSCSAAANPLSPIFAQISTPPPIYGSTMHAEGTTISVGSQNATK